MLFNALQLGIRVNLEDLAVHTFMDLTEYAGKIYGGKDDSPSMNFGDMRKAGIKRG